MKEQTVNILLVEDSDNHAQMIREALLAGAGRVELTVARSLAEARALLSDSIPDLVIVDLLLPDGRGVELLTAGDGAPRWPAVIMTGQGDEAAAVEAMKAGALDYLVKSAETLAALPRTVEGALRAWQHVKERRKAEEALRRKQQKYQSLIETIDDWVWEVDADGVYTYASPNVRTLLGYEPEEVVGRTPFHLMPEAEARRLAEAFSDIAQRREPFRSLQNTNRHKNGHDVVLESSGVPYFAEDGTFLGYRGVDRDISERKEAEGRLREANRDLAAFAHTVSHDLRLPLTAILGFSELLRERYRGALDEEGLDMLATIQRQGERMLALMEDLLTLAKVGHLGRPSEPVASGEVVREVLLDLGSRITDAGLAVHVERMPAVRLSRTLLAQVFANLLGNALNYAGGAGASVEVGGGRRGERVRFYVRDHGPGIPEAERDRVFESFCRGGATGAEPGTGIGLAIVRKVARLYDGRAWVEETPGGGSTFYVEVADARSGDG